MALPSTEIPMGAYVHDGGTYFRVWAPTAEAVHVALLAPGTSSPATWQADATNILAKDANGFWSGYFQGVGYGWQYRYWTTGPAGQGYKRDPRAFELELETYPDCHCRIVKRDGYPWHDQDFTPPRFNDFIIYQLHWVSSTLSAATWIFGQTASASFSTSSTGSNIWQHWE